MTKDKKTTAVAVLPSAETLAELRDAFPVEAGYSQVQLPRLGMFAQDQTEGKGKAMKVVSEAGTFFIDKQTDEEDAEGKKKWEKEEIGTELEGIIFFQRKQLKYFDETTETYTSSAVYDGEDEVVPLFTNKAEVARGTPAELRARPEYQFEKDGKVKSKLEDNRILYVLKDGEVYQMNLRGSSMYSYMTYARKVLPPSVLTVMNSEAKEKGSIAWNQMTFTEKRKLSAKEIEEVQEKLEEVRKAVKEQKEFYASMTISSAKAKDDLKNF